MGWSCSAERFKRSCLLCSLWSLPPWQCPATVRNTQKRAMQEKVLPPSRQSKEKEARMDIGTLVPLLAITDEGLRFIGAGMAIGLGGAAPALGIGWLVSKAMEALGRNPEAQPVIQTNMILGIAFAEAIAIYALVVAVMIGFVF